ncbi:RagB/SusD family nutrient uptake outer membrane protein [Hymenobacter bucti]|uniref:RagB/SusD family nutrient uptake outer membrane protein n=1 Tax=Hymenobacter bucti TaxID=1844114 RepID=A0ABW4QR37_9BACT
MKRFINGLCAAGCLALLSLTGCKDYLVEENLGGRTAETYYGTAQGFEDLVKSTYSPLRPLLSYTGMFFLGTDIFTVTEVGSTNAFNSYDNNLNSSNPDLDSYWKEAYYAIQLTNTVQFWSTQVTGLDAATVATRVAETKALRAYHYFLLAETFGDVPLVLAPATQPTFGFARTPEKDVYTQVIKDLTEAIDGLPATTANFGRVTKGMAQHLLAKVYLTRGYKSYGAGQADFTKAGQLAETLITSGPYALSSNFASLFDPSNAGFQVNSEVIFSVQYNANVESSRYYYINNPSLLITGNGLHNLFNMEFQTYPTIGRSAYYGKSTLYIAPTSYLYTLFDKTRDARYQSTFATAIYAQVATAGFAVGDTVIYFPDVPFSAARKATKKYNVYNFDEYENKTSFSPRSLPYAQKFREVNVPYSDNNLGIRDTYVFRLAETYLIASEAYLKAGDMAKAVQYYNVIRTRAGKTGTNPATNLPYKDELKATSITIDNILDERARELFGEELRWYELKRTGKLLERGKLYNKELAKYNRLQSFNLLRPIPQTQIDLNRADFTQNPGY